MPRIGVELDDPTGLGSLVSGMKGMQEGLFPDPAKYAAAGYYGAKQRETQLQGNVLADQLNSRARLFKLLQGDQPIPAQYAPATAGGSAQGPLVWTPQAQQQQPSLASTVAPPAILDPQKTADYVSNPNGPMQTGGQAPPMSSPVPGAPPAPNTTTTNGQVPQNDAQRFHPGSVTDGNGGLKQSGPAAANGSPSPNSLNLSQMVALAVYSGMDPAAAKQLAAAYITDLYTKGRIDKGTATRMNAELDPGTIYKEDAATGRTAMQEAGATTRTGMQEAGATGRTRMTEAGATERTGMTERGHTERTGMTERGATERTGMTEAGATGRTAMAPTNVINPENGQAQTIPLGDLKRPEAPFGVYDPGVAGKQAEQRAHMVWVPAPGGGYTRKLQSAVTPGEQVVNDTVAEEAMKTVQVTTPQGTKSMPNWQATAQGLARAPENVGQVQAGAAAAAAAGSPQTPLGQIVAGGQPPVVASGQDASNEMAVRSQVTNSYFKPTSPELLKQDYKSVTFDAETTQELDRLTQELKTNPNSGVFNNDRAAWALAIQTLQSKGMPDGRRLPKDTDPPAVWSRFANKTVRDAKGNKVLEVGLIPPAGASATPTPAPANMTVQQMYGGTGTPSLANTVAPTPAPAPAAKPAATGGTMPPGALGPAPPGVTGNVKDPATGQLGVVVGGWIMPR